MSTFKKPALVRFLKDQLIPFSSRGSVYTCKGHPERYKESRRTRVISYLVMLLFGGIAYGVILTREIRIHNLVEFILSIIVLFVCIVLLEIFHWFYAVFEKI